MFLKTHALYLKTTKEKGMARIAGVQKIKDNKGRVTKLVIDVKKHEAFLEDFLDHLSIQEAKSKKQVYHPWEKVRKELNRKHGFTD